VCAVDCCFPTAGLVMSSVMTAHRSSSTVQSSGLMAATAQLALCATAVRRVKQVTSRLARAIPPASHAWQGASNRKPSPLLAMIVRLGDLPAGHRPLAKIAKRAFSIQHLVQTALRVPSDSSRHLPLALLRATCALWVSSRTLLAKVCVTNVRMDGSSR